MIKKKMDDANETVNIKVISGGNLDIYLFPFIFIRYTSIHK